jgi:hypothetical protein
MQDLHLYFDVNGGVPTQVTTKKALFQKEHKIRNNLFEYWQENDKNQ